MIKSRMCILQSLRHERSDFNECDKFFNFSFASATYTHTHYITDKSHFEYPAQKLCENL